MGCLNCNLAEQKNRPGCWGSGNKILFIGETPTRSGVEVDEAITGEVRMFFLRLLKKARIPQADVSYLNMVRCFPSDVAGDRRDLTSNEILNCLDRLMIDVNQLSPSVVCFLSSVVERQLKKTFPGYKTIPAIDFLYKTGAERSPYYLTIVRKLEAMYHGV